MTVSNGQRQVGESLALHRLGIPHELEHGGDKPRPAKVRGPVRAPLIGLDWIGLDCQWIGLPVDWIGLDWIGLDWIGLDLI